MPKQTTTEKAAATPAKKTASRKKVIQLYAKPEDSMLYYVINGESGSVAL